MPDGTSCHRRRHGDKDSHLETVCADDFPQQHIDVSYLLIVCIKLYFLHSVIFAYTLPEIRS